MSGNRGFHCRSNCRTCDRIIMTMDENEEKAAEDAVAAPPIVSSDLLDEIQGHCQSASDKLNNGAQADLFQHAARALECFDILAPIMHDGDQDIAELLLDTREELQDAYLAVIAGRSKLGFIMLRGVMEGLLTTLFYRQQTISLNVWASGDSFHMVHQMLSGQHEFRLYFKRLFEDERFRIEYPQVTHSNVFDHATTLYDTLSSYVHKKSRGVQSNLPGSFEGNVESVLRVVVCFLEREEELPKLSFPSPASLATVLLELKAKPQGKKK